MSSVSSEEEKAINKESVSSEKEDGSKMSKD